MRVQTFVIKLYESETLKFHHMVSVKGMLREVAKSGDSNLWLAQFHFRDKHRFYFYGEYGCMLLFSF